MYHVERFITSLLDAHEQTMNAFRSYLRFNVLAVLVATVSASISMAQKPDANPEKPHEMLMTQAGLIAMDTPEGWEQADGPGMAFFLPKGADSSKPAVWIYLSGIPVGPNESAKDTASAIQSDISEFKKHFPNGIARKEKPLTLPLAKEDATVYTFESGEAHNSFEQVIYIDDAGQVLTLTLSARNRSAFDSGLPALKAFATSYGGTVHVTTPK
jgi:hypothetical protein